MPDHDGGRTTVREVLRVREFRALLGASALSLAGDQITRIAVAVLVYERTRSPLAVTATLACSYLSWLLAGPLLATVADRLPRRRLMVWCDLLRAALVAVLVLPDVPLPVVFAVLLLSGLLSPPFEAARSALLPEILTGDRYVVGSGLQSGVFQAAHVAGFLLGGAVVAATGARGALALDALTFLLSAALVGAAVRERPLPVRAPASLLADTAAGVRLVVGDPRLRRSLAYGLVGAVLMIAPEGLAVPVADGLGGGPRTAGVLTAAVPLGFVLGSLAVLRVPPDRRAPLMPGLGVLAGVALLLTPLTSSAPAVAVLWTVCGAGSALSLVANAAFMLALPGEARGRGFGVAVTALMALQGGTLLLLGAVATGVGPDVAVALAGGAALLALVPLAGRPPVPALSREVGVQA